MKLRQLLKVTMVVMTGFCLLGTDNNNAIASNSIQLKSNTDYKKETDFIKSLYQFWKDDYDNDRHYILFLGVKSSCNNKNWENNIHNIYLKQCLEYLLSKNPNRNTAYAIINDNAVIHGCDQFNRYLKDENIKCLNYVRTINNIKNDISELIKIFYKYKDTLNKIGKISSVYKEYIEFCHNLLLLYQTKNINFPIMSKNNPNKNKQEYYHNIANDDEYNILMSIMFITFGNIIHECIKNIHDAILGNKGINDTAFQCLCIEFQYLYYELNQFKFLNKLNIINKLKNIKLFTYQDMCPSCWAVWNKYLKIARQLNIIDKDFSVEVYSIKPYNFTQHVFYNLLPSSLQRRTNYNYHKWYTMDVFDKDCTRRKFSDLSTCKNLKQYIDKDGNHLLREIMNNNVYNIFGNYYIYNKQNTSEINTLRSQIINLFNDAGEQCISRLKNNYKTLSELINGEKSTVQFLSTM